MAVVKRKASHRNALSPIIEELRPGDLPTLKNILPKAIGLKESTNQTNNNFTNQMLGNGSYHLTELQKSKFIVNFIPIQ